MHPKHPINQTPTNKSSIHLNHMNHRNVEGNQKNNSRIRIPSSTTKLVNIKDSPFGKPLIPILVDP